MYLITIVCIAFYLAISFVSFRCGRTHLQSFVPAIGMSPKCATILAPVYHLRTYSSYRRSYRSQNNEKHVVDSNVRHLSNYENNYEISDRLRSARPAEVQRQGRSTPDRSQIDAWSNPDRPHIEPRFAWDRPWGCSLGVVLVVFFGQTTPETIPLGVDRV